MTKILLVDDHPVVLEGLKAALNKYANVEIVGEASDGWEAVQKTQSLRPDVVIMDVAMPRFDGVESTKRIKKIAPNIKVIIYTMHSYKEFLRDLMKAGISAYVSKQHSISDLYLAVQVVNRGGTYLSQDASSFWANHVRTSRVKRESGDLFDLLSPRERQVFELLSEGVSIREAAKTLCISTKTVETHKYRIMEKLQLRSLPEWTKEAIRRGIIKVEGREKTPLAQ
jgi:DNA-binding NarL/FixJ family response regulator